MLDKVAISDLKIGMYLVEISKPEGKFQLLESGLIKNEKTIALLHSKGVEELLIDTERAQIEAEDNSILPPKQSFKEKISKAKSVFNES